MNLQDIHDNLIFLSTGMFICDMNRPSYISTKKGGRNNGKIAKAIGAYADFV